MKDYRWTVSGPWDKGCKETETEWKMEVEGDVCYVAFKGSTSSLDWKQNFSFWVKPYKGQESLWFAHAGFVKKWKSIRDEVYNTVLSNDIKIIEIYGFSQGGAIATLCHEDFIFNKKDVLVNTFVYGAPRVIWVFNYRKIKERFMNLNRMEFTSDIVTKVPPVFMGYIHVGERIKKKHKLLMFFWNFKKIHMSYKDF